MGTIIVTTLFGFVAFLLVVFLMARKIRKNTSSNAASGSEGVAANAEEHKKRSRVVTVGLKIVYFLLAVGIIFLVLRLALVISIV